MSNLASELVTALLKCSRSLSRGWRRGSISTLLQTLLMNAVNKSWTPSCICATKPPFLHERAWPTVNLSPHTPRLGISTRGKLYRRRSESLNSCLLRAKLWSARGIAFNQEFAPLSLDWLTSHSRSEERVDATLSIFSLSRVVLSDWWYLLSSSVELSPGTINVFCDVIESTCAEVIDFEAENCCGALALKSCMPRPPWAVFLRWRVDAPRWGEALIDRTKLEEVSRQSPPGLDQHNPQTNYLAHEVGELWLIPFCEGNVCCVRLTLCNFGEPFDFLFPYANFLLTILIFVFLRRNDCS